MPNIADIYPLSSTQQGLLFHSLLAPEKGIYIPQIVLSLSGNLDTQILKQSWERALHRHEILRTGFQWEQRDEPFQVVYHEVSLQWIELDWSDSPKQQDKKLKALQAANQSEGFNLQSAPLTRFHLIRLSDSSFKLVWCYHHLILDGWSAGQVLQEVLTDYFALAKGLTVSPIQASRSRYKDYIAWLLKQNAEQAEKFWTESLVAESFSSSSHQENAKKFGEESFVFSSEQSNAIRQWTQTHQVTLHTLLLGIIGILLGRYQDSRNVTLGHTVSGRPSNLPDSTKMVGLFINTLPVSLSLLPQAPIITWLKDLQKHQADASSYEYVALRDIQSWTNQGNPLFDWLFVLESYPLPAGSNEKQDNLRLDGTEFDEWTHFPMTLLAIENDTLTIKAKYQEPRFSQSMIHNLFSHLNEILQQILCNPDQPLSSITLYTQEERKIVQSWNATEQNWKEHALSITEPIEQFAESAMTALRFRGINLNYKEIHEKASQLAALLKKTGAGPEQPVAVYLERSLELPITLLAILKANAVYFPLDPSYPKARLQSLLEESTPVAIVTDQRQNLQELKTNCRVIDWANEKELEKTLSIPHIPSNPNPDQALYLIYTSGSTGKPKGVINTHQALANRLLWMQEQYSLTSSDRVLQKTPVGFDVSVWEFFWPIMTGATLVLAEPEQHKDGQALVELIQKEKITVLHFVPPMLEVLLEISEVVKCTCLRLIICSGEKLNPSTVAKCKELLPNTSLQNLYGPTEAAIDVTHWSCDQGQAMTQVPIGKPIANTSIHILDQDLNELPTGVEGELYIGGIGLARGYAQRADLTAERFIPNPYYKQNTPSSSEVLYRTGDLARYAADGTIEFLGRNDHQIKIRGQRIELAEIEYPLNEHPSVKQSHVSQLPSSRELVAYLVLEDKSISIAENPRAHFEGYLKAHLTEAMIPHRWVVLSKFPLTTNGKIDHKALPDPISSKQEFQPLENSTQETIAKIWSEMLNIETIGANAHFFELGGHSLSATRANTRLRKEFDVELPLRVHFECPILLDLANHIDALLISSNLSEKSEDHIEIEI
ncbi:MAG: amino acid adenylation domain-containing protein [Verrucomicrobiota bacterium]